MRGEDHVQLIRDSIEAWNRRGIDGLLPYVAADGVTTPFEEWPDDDIYHGVEGFRKLMRQWEEQFEGIHWELERAEALDGGRVLALIHHNGTIKGAGVPISAPIGAIFSDFREGGQVARAEFYLGWEKAVEAAGLLA